MEKGQFLQQMVPEKLDIYMEVNDVGLLPYTICKNQPQITKDLNLRPETIKLLEEKHRGEAL